MLLHRYQGPFPVPGGLVGDLGPHCGGVEYVPTVEPVTGESDLVIIGEEEVNQSRRRGKRPNRPEPSINE